MLRVSLADIEPAIWRTIGIPDRYSLHQLHRILQLAFGWLDYHLYSFELGKRRFEAPSPEAEDEDSSRAILGDLLFKVGTKFTYIYDFGDDWRHDIRVEEVSTLPTEEGMDALPRLLAGANAGPPEDVGGPQGFADFMASLTKSRHSEHGANRDWVGDDYDPRRFDPWIVDRHLQLTAAWGVV